MVPLSCDDWLYASHDSRWHLLTDLNPRLGARVDVIPETDRQQDGSIWLGVYEQNNRVVIVTADRKKFSWEANAVDTETFAPLIKYLRRKTIKEAKSTALKMESSLTRSTAILAIDQRLRYSHIKPILYALSEAKISQYGFETRIIH